MNESERRSAEEILSHLERHGIARKDPPPPKGRAGKRNCRGRRSRLHRMTLDLHGMRSEEAAARLRDALDRCRETGTRELLVIHGYGLHSDPAEGPVLKKIVRELLDRDLRPGYRSYRTASPADGGEGATLVALR